METPSTILHPVVASRDVILLWRHQALFYIQLLPQGMLYCCGDTKYYLTPSCCLKGCYIVVETPSTILHPVVASNDVILLWRHQALFYTQLLSQGMLYCCGDTKYYFTPSCCLKGCYIVVETPSTILHPVVVSRNVILLWRHQVLFYTQFFASMDVILLWRHQVLFYTQLLPQMMLCCCGDTRYYFTPSCCLKVCYNVVETPSTILHPVVTSRDAILLWRPQVLFYTQLLPQWMLYCCGDTKYYFTPSCCLKGCYTAVETPSTILHPVVASNEVILLWRHQALFYTQLLPQWMLYCCGDTKYYFTPSCCLKGCYTVVETPSTILHPVVASRDVILLWRHQVLFYTQLLPQMKLYCCGDTKHYFTPSCCLKGCYIVVETPSTI